jgi:anaerobic selenocysteine-containing dehydrogenase
MRDIRVRPYDITPGNVAMYFPEANILVPTTTDPASKTPAFKSVLVKVEPAVVVGDLEEGRRPLAVVAQ